MIGGEEGSKRGEVRSLSRSIQIRAQNCQLESAFFLKEVGEKGGGKKERETSEILTLWGGGKDRELFLSLYR